ncbi:3-oxoacyl-ACP reductase [Roseivivax halodurans JCM 10272]|uniref:3-oxoacyl-ACP reductase n=1 Tax=Roseivivax halodurans JCM 10272 TaxID=1449350 RepID=X7EIH6_9RHOB|nr:SDR family oxidoreductase [Roseivivax halodurans]ETX15889.1 3-oxoacyl-ACP reductase [Roseivivax halodurans JCM 10272]
MPVALVTGASRGLGATIARTLAADGWSVAVNYARNAEAAEAVAGEIRAAGGHAEPAGFDVTDKTEIATAMAEIRESLGPVDLLVNNATGPQPTMPLMEQSWEDHAAQLDFFVNAPLLLVKACLPDWRARGTGRIVNIGSEAAETGPAEFGHYAAAKAAMLGLTRSWASELAPDGITVNLVAPGFTPVERHADVGEEDRATYREGVPLGRLAEPGDIAGAVAFLASSRADFITGQRLAVNGGRTFH